MITSQAKARCENESLQEQLERCRREMQQASGSNDMKDVDLRLNNDNAWGGHYARLVMPIDGAD